MRPTRLWLFALLALASFALSTAALADPSGGGPGGPGGDPGARFQKMISNLGLDATQQEKVQAIFDNAKPQRDALRAQMREAFQQMRTLLDQDAPDQNAVLAQADRLGQLTTEMHKQRLTTLLAVRAELRPDQRAKLKAEMMNHGPGGGGRWHRHRGMGGPGGSGSGTGTDGTSSPPPPEE